MKHFMRLRNLPTHPHFVACTILHWIPIFTRKESVQIVIGCLKFLQEKDDLKLYAYVVLERGFSSLNYITGEMERE